MGNYCTQKSKFFNFSQQIRILPSENRKNAPKSGNLFSDAPAQAPAAQLARLRRAEVFLKNSKKNEK